MGLFDIFKKNKTLREEENDRASLKEAMKWNKMWELWEVEQAKSPYQELMTYQSEVNNGGHSQFFFNLGSIKKISTTVKTVLTVLPPKLAHNLEQAYSVYNKYNKTDEDKMEKILDGCDEVFFANEEKINEILEKYADTL